MAFDVQGARRAGYSDTEIAEFLAPQLKFDVAQARQAGYSDEEIVTFLTKPVKQSSITGEAVRGVKQAVSSARTGIGSIFGDAPEAAAAGLERGQEIAEAAGEGPSFERLRRVYGEQGVVAAGKQALSDLPRAVAGQAGTLASMYAGGKLGAVAGAPLGPAGALIGGGVGATAALLPQLFGSNIERQAAEQQEAGVPVDPNLARAGAAAAGQAALESVGTGFVLGKRVISGLLGITPVQLTTEAAKAKLVREAARTLAGGAARGAAVEIPVEIAQSVIERAQAGLDVTSEDAFKEYGEAAYLAGLVGGPLGSVGTGVSRGAARRELAEREAAAAPPTEAPAPEVAPAPLADMSIGQLYQEEARLSALLDAGRQPKEVVDRIKEVRELKKQFNIADAEDVILRREASRVQAEQDQAFAAQSALSQPEQGEFRETALAPWEERQLRQRAEEGQPPAPEPEAATPVGEQLALPGISPPITREMLVEAGLPEKPRSLQQKAAVKWAEENIVGRSPDEVRAILESPPDIVKNVKALREALRAITTVTPMPFEESAIGRPAATALPEPLGPELGGSEPSVELPSAGSPVGGELGAPGAPATPVGAGVGPAELPAAQGAVPERSEPLAVTEPVPAAQALAPFLSPERITPQAERALEPYVATMQADRAEPTEFPRYIGWDLMSGSTFDPQTREITRIGFAPEKGRGVTAKQAEAAFNALTPEAQQQVVQEAQNYFEQEVAAGRARERMDRKQDEQAQELDEAVGQAELAEEYGLSEARPRVTETPTGRRVEGVRYQQEQAEAPDGVPLSPEVLNELNTNGVADALNLLATTTDNPIYAALARRLSLLLGNTKVNIVDDLRNTEGKPAAGAASTSGRDIWLDRVRGLNEETFLHESVHAASEMVLATPADKRTAVQNVAVRELNSLWDAAKADPDIKLGTDARESLSEFVTEALTNPKLIKDLKAKPWTLGSAWDQFKRTVLKMLGVKVPANMQEAAIAAMDTIFEPPSLRRDAQGKLLFQLAPNVQAALKSQDTRQPKTLGAAIKGAFGGGGQPGAMDKDVVATESKVRTMLSDKAATVFDEINAAVNKGMISAMEAKTVQTLFKQAEAADQLIPEFLRRGALKLNAKLGLWQVADGKNAPVKAIEMVEAWGKKNGLKFDDAWDYAARLIESGRQHEFRRLNALAKPGETKFPLTKNFPIDTLYAAYKADKDLLALKDILDESRKQLIDNMVSVGRLSKKEGAEWKLAAEYVPFDRLEQFGDKLRQQKRTGRGIAALGKLPELIDAAVVDRPVGNALENYFKTLGWMVEQTVRTDALNKTLTQLEKIGQAKYRGMNRDAIQNKSMAVRAFRDGNEIWYEVPTIYHAAAFNANVGPLPKFLEVFGTISRVLRTSITALPTFTASQLPQDIQRAILYSGVKNPAMLTARALSNFKSLSRHALKGTLYEGSPIQSEFGVVGDVDFNRKDPARSILEELGFADRTLLGSKKAGTILHRLNELARASDIAIRKSIYEQTLAETGDQLLALQRAREIINFRSTGSGDPLGILPVMIQTIPFFNAYIQGTDVLYRSLTGSQAVSGLARKAALQQFYTLAGALAAGSVVYALMMAGDDEYENMNLDERDRSWVLGGGFSLPVPSEIGMIFKAIPERVTEAMLKNGTPDEKAGMIAVTSWFRAAFMEYAGRTVPIPAAAKPVLEAWTGYSFRTGRQLEGVFQEGLDASERTNTSTSEFAKEVARFASKALGMEISPIKIDNTLNGYFGTTAALTLAASDGLINPDKADRPLHQMVGLTPFTYDPVGNRRISEFYDLREKVVSAQNTLNTLMKQDINRAREYVERKRPELLAYKAVNATLKELQATRAYKQFLDTPAAAQQMTSEERMLKKREVQAYEQKLAEWTRMARKELDL